MRYLFLFLSTFFIYQSAFSQMYNTIAVDATVRSAEDGKITTLKTTIYYNVNGKMVTYYSRPDNIVIINNERGQVSVYDKDNNSVIQSQNAYYSTKTNELYYFINNKKDDLGLAEIGFTIKDVNYEDGLTVTEWWPPSEGMKYFSSIKIVHDKENPIFMEYKDHTEMVVKKVYFYNYEQVNQIDFPRSITQIDFKTERDSIVSKTQYENIRFNVPEATEKLNFKIPTDAKLIK